MLESYDIPLTYSSSGNDRTSCKTLSASVDFYNIPVDSCSSFLPVNTFKISSQDRDTVTFSVTQNCNSEWIASDFVGLNSELICIKNPVCGVPELYTATCLDGITIVDLYIHGKSFGQIDGSMMVIPNACDVNGGGSSLCHFRYMLKCSPSKCERSIQANGKKLRQGI